MSQKIQGITKQEAQELVKKWAKVLDYSDNRVPEIVDESVRTNTAIILENEANYLKEAITAGPGGAYGSPQNSYSPWSADNYATGDARVPLVAIPMVRRAFPALITNEIVGVQPLAGPLGLAFALRYRYDNQPLGDDGRVKYGPKASDPDYYPQNSTGIRNPSAEPFWGVGASDGKEIGYNTLDTRFTGTTGDYSSFTSGLTAVTGTLHDAATGLISDFDKGVARALSQFEMTGNIPTARITFEKANVEAGTRRMAASWSVESEQDIKAMNGIDIKEEMINVLSYEVQAEIDREMLTRMFAICLKAGTASPSKGKGFSMWQAGTADGRWYAERCRDFYGRLLVESNRIAIQSRRGAANFIVATPRVCAMLEQLPDFKGFPVNGTVSTQQAGVAKVGTIGGRFTVYRDTRTEAQYDMGDRDTAIEYALLGYKGTEAYDSGIVYCPYVPVMVQQAMDPNTFSPRIGVMTRYGVVDHLFGAEIFYHLIFVLGLGDEIDSLADQKRVFMS